jgi:hypothetical protein
MFDLCGSVAQEQAYEVQRRTWNTVIPSTSVPVTVTAVDHRPPSIKTPEQVARELEERVLQDVIRARQWRRRRETYRVVTMLVGLLVPSLSLMFAGMISNGGFANWTARAGWLPFISTALGGLVVAALAFAFGWGISRSMMAFGALFMVVVAVNQARLGTVVIAMPGLVCLFITAGALVGYLTSMEEGN